MRSLIRSASKDALQHLVFRGRFLWRLPRGTNAVALTFDDGPHPIHTPATLDMLARAGVKATFFMVGREVEKYPELARRVVDEGHAVGGHSLDHTVITALSAEALVDDLRRCRDVISTATGADTTLFRPPKGEVSLGSIRTVCRAGYTLVHWSRTFSDYRQDGTVALSGRMHRAPPGPGDIVLFHDNNPFTVEALDAQIARWRNEGLTFTTL